MICTVRFSLSAGGRMDSHLASSHEPSPPLSSSVPSSGSSAVPARPRLGVKALPRTNPSFRLVELYFTPLLRLTDFSLLLSDVSYG